MAQVKDGTRLSALTSVPGNSNQIAEVSPGKAGKGVNRRESAASAVASLSGRHAYVSLEYNSGTMASCEFRLLICVAA